MAPFFFDDYSIAKAEILDCVMPRKLFKSLSFRRKNQINSA